MRAISRAATCFVLDAAEHLPQQTLQEAAVIAAYHSQGRKEREVEVSYTAGEPDPPRARRQAGAGAEAQRKRAQRQSRRV